MKYISQDDMVISTKTRNIHSSTKENIDYLEYIPMNSEHYLNDNLNLLAYIKLNENVENTTDDLIIKRINNICWRRCNKNLFQVDEFKPYLINWDKNSDITWLFGPKVVIPEEQEEEQPQEETTSTIAYPTFNFEESEEVCSLLSDDEDEEEEDSQSEVSSVLSFERKNSLSSASSYFEEEDDEDYEYNLKSSIKKTCSKSTKKVSFNYIVNTREIINGISFDYDFLDHECL
ncbi:hypothetical protein DFJ63DRAFT_152684 [Scheffersomyces coipomensis]|uniref:uncharacterized protein n=1 Tax=Scheffersomyces coipomensis TaxID=1788519 RepID=UPI00315DBE2D